MGEPVRIADLARDMIRLSGRSEDEVRVVFTGAAPGETLRGVLADSEHTRATHHPKLRIARAQSVEDGWLDALLLWLRQRRAVGASEVRGELRRWVPGIPHPILPPRPCRWWKRTPIAPDMKSHPLHMASRTCESLRLAGRY
jgi:hypothetical protein